MSASLSFLGEKFYNTENTNKSSTFPVHGKVPVLALGFEGTLKDPKSGEPFSALLWALRCFRWNSYEIDVFSDREDTESIWSWLNRFLPGLVDRVNQSRYKTDNGNGGLYYKPVADIYIEGRSEYWVGRDIDWTEIVGRLWRHGFLPHGLLHKDGGSQMLSVLQESFFVDIVSEMKESATFSSFGEDSSIHQINKCVQETSETLRRGDKRERAVAGGHLLYSVLSLLKEQNFDPLGCILLAQREGKLNEVSEVQESDR